VHSETSSYSKQVLKLRPSSLGIKLDFSKNCNWAPTKLPLNVKATFANSGVITEDDVKIALNTTNEKLNPNSCELILNMTLYYKSDVGKQGTQLYLIKIPVVQAEPDEDFGDQPWSFMVGYDMADKY